MMQIKLLQISWSLKPGEAIKIPLSHLHEAAKGDLPSIDRSLPARKNDIDEFVTKARANWGVILTEDLFKDTYTMYKPTDLN